VTVEYAFCFGSNQGERMKIFREARRCMTAYDDAHELAASPVYETEPVGVKDEYKDLPYLNAVLVLESTEPAQTWLERLQSVEEQFGRVRSTDDRFAPRTLDIDMLYCDQEIIDSGGLSVPHPRWAERRFVIQPLCDVRPDKIMPGAGQTVQAILEMLNEDKDVQEFSKDW
jgi:2-amino-4-hydroxy-6-hydroxymethyldihydropteridine diphosphokinase